MFVLVYSYNENAWKRYIAFRYYLSKGIVDNYNIINGKNQSIDSDIKLYKEIKKLAIQQDKDYTTIGCLLVYDYVKNHYRLVAVNLSIQKELNADPKAIQQKEFVGRLK